MFPGPATTGPPGLPTTEKVRRVPHIYRTRLAIQTRQAKPPYRPPASQRADGPACRLGRIPEG
jgi:hypothetical protein